MEAAGAVSGFPQGLTGKDPRDFEVYEPVNPQAEPHRGVQAVEALTPAERFFVRNNHPPPAVDDPRAWQLRVAGVREPATVTAGQLVERLPRAETAAVLQCAGNGRRWMAGEPEGTPWGTGAAGCARWGGVRVADLVELLGGLAAGARYCTAAGAEPVTDPVDRMERSVPLDKALRDALLAVDMNGEPLSLAHGGPLRLIVPGWYAVNSVKYVARLAFTTAESDAAISTIRYRVSPMGAAPSPQHQTCGPMNPKSWMLEPAGNERITPGAVTVRGLALGGEHPLSGVEVTADGGQTWQPGGLEPPDLGPFAWRVFTAELELGPGRHVVATRAADASGRRQPRHSEPNDQGYRANGWQELAVTLEVVAG